MSRGLGWNPSTGLWRGAPAIGLAAPWRAFSRVGGVCTLVGRPRALLSLLAASLRRWSPRAARAAGAVRREPGRAQRGLDLFLGQNRTNRGSGDATAP